MNFVAAVYYAEVRACEESNDQPQQQQLRKAWLKNIRRCLPSCFCDPDFLK
jgi:hypothetical protein